MTEPDSYLDWSNRGSDFFLAALDRVADSDFGLPSLLPGWTVGHLVAHVAYNATALSRLMYWARSGVETRMYPSREARDAEIEQGSRLPPELLREMVAQSDAQLRTEFAELPASSWDNEIITAQGVARRAAEIPWMRAREVWIHAVDLGEADFADFPAELIDALIADVTRTRGRREDSPALIIRTRDRSRSWTVSIPGEQPSTVEGEAVDLCRWLTGRGTLAGAEELSHWL